MTEQRESTTKSLKAWREEIDALDSQLLRLLNQRAAIACQIGAVKVASGLPAYDGRREREVLARIRAQNPGPFASESVTRIFRRIILETRKIGMQAMQKQAEKQRQTKTAVQERSNGYQHGSRRV
jgi:chorismate mutase-like protein